MINIKQKALNETLRHYLVAAPVGLIISFLSVKVFLWLLPFLDVLEQNFLIKGGLSVILTYLILRTYFHFEHYNYLQKHCLAQSIIIKGAFLTYYKENSTNAEIIKAEKELSERARNAMSIYILGASGLRTFGNTDAPLYECIGNCTDLCVILLHPLGTGIKKRVTSLVSKGKNNVSSKDIKKALNKYINETKKAIGTLKRIHNQNSEKVKLYFYDEEPLLKVIIIDHKMIWLQHYETGTHVRDVPSYFFEKEEAASGMGLFKALLDIYERKRSHIANYPYDFQNNKIWNPTKKQYELFP